MGALWQLLAYLLALYIGSNVGRLAHIIAHIAGLVLKTQDIYNINEMKNKIQYGQYVVLFCLLP